MHQKQSRMPPKKVDLEKCWNRQIVLTPENVFPLPEFKGEILSIYDLGKKWQDLTKMEVEFNLSQIALRGKITQS